MLKHIPAILAAASLSLPFGLLAGCEETVVEKKTVETKSDGTVVKEEKKTTRDPSDGSTKTTTEKEVDKSKSTDR